MSETVMVSVCMPTVKSLEEVQDRIDEIEENTVYTHEIIVESNPDSGVALNRNKCLIRSHGLYIIFVDDDLYGYFKGWDKILIDKLREDRSVAIIGPRLLNMNGMIQHTNSKCGNIEDDFIEVEMIPGACMAYTKNYLFFDERYKRWGYEDPDFILRMIREGLGRKILLTNKVKLRHKNEFKHMDDYLHENKTLFVSRYNRLYE